MKQRINFLLAGVGGQGVLTASNILSAVGLAVGYDVKKSEVHGMSQRGGNVTSHVRWGEKVYAPLIGGGEVDFLMAFEAVESLRYLEMLRPEATIIADNHQIIPITVTDGAASYPSQEAIDSWLRQVTPHVFWVPGMAIAEKMGNARVANIVLLGFLAALLRMPDDVWHNALVRWVPKKVLALNEEALAAGRALNKAPAE